MSGSIENDINVPIYLTFTSTLFLIGFTSNLLIILAVLYNKRLRVRGYAFIINLAASDFAVLVLSDFFIILGIVTRGKIFTNNVHFCQISSYFCLALCLTSIWNMAFGSLHSYVRICHRLRYHRIVKPKIVACALISTWLIGLSILLPSLLGWGGHGYNTILRYCVFDYLESSSYTTFVIAVGVVLPLVIATYSFVRIFVDVLTSRRKLRHINPETAATWMSFPRSSPMPPRINKTDARLLKSFFFVVLYLTSSWLFLMTIWVNGQSSSWSPRQTAYAMTVAHSHCSVNGMLYTMTNKEFRETCAKLFHCGKGKRDVRGSERKTINERM